MKSKPGVKEYYRRNLPHYQPPYATFFITACLTGSLSSEMVQRLKDEYELFKSDLKKGLVNAVNWKKYYSNFDDFLDKAQQGNAWLNDDRVAAVVAEAIHYRDRSVYDLLAFTIMSNHVHIVFSVQRNDISLYRILQSLKRHTARKCNIILERRGAFWLHESYDHVIRDSDELERVIAYVLENPVKAGFVNHWRSWKWNYVRPDFEHIMPE